MRDWQGKRYWLIGASEGLGRALAHQMSRAGVELVLSARSPQRLRALSAELPGRALCVPADVGDRASVEAAAQRAGRLDGVIYMAGAYWPMPAQEWDAAKVETMCDTNFTGAARVLGTVIPDMVARDSGHVVLVSSLSGFRGLPGSIGYGSSKAGVMHLAESMHADLRRTGVQVQVVNPGFVRTRLTEKNTFRMPFLMDPEPAARAIFEHMGTDRFKRSFPLLFSLVFRLGQFLPDALYYRLIARA
ncbi:short-chain dehydrogenase [Rhodobacteraceae bacterium WD3A24]|nr:short-chain dehydrogenase [Rhodobacteraceae bacterium WD3A24]